MPTADGSAPPEPVPSGPLPRRPALAVWGLALWLVLLGNLPLWQRIAGLEGSLAQRAVWLLCMGCLLLGALGALLSLLAWSRVLRPVAAALLLVSALNSHFMWQYGAVIDSTMLANVLHTDLREAGDLMSWSLLGSALLALPGLWWLWRRPLLRRPVWAQAGRNALGLAAGVLVLLLVTFLGYQDLAPLMRNHKALRYMANPLNTVYAAGQLLAQQWPQQAQARLPVGLDVRLGSSYAKQARPPLLLLVVGETARAQNFGLNGYPRPTTPTLARWQAERGLVNFSQVRACGTNTQVSVPCLFSPLTRAQGGNRAALHDNLLDLLQRAGLAVLWLDNQSGCKGVCARVPSVRTADLKLAPWCTEQGCFDAVMLDQIDARIAALAPERRARGVVLVMHQMGSHGPAYFKRTPADQKVFLPECSSNTLSDCSPEALRNTYDNSVAYTDHFLGQALDWLAARAEQGAFDSGLVYVSDHGESLGEKGLYLHGLPYALAPDEQTRVPMVSWLSPGLRQRSGVAVDCLRTQAARPLSHDHFFHSVLGLLDLQTSAYQAGLDLFAPCAPAAQGSAGFKPPPAN